MVSYAIVGASRGIGLEWVRQLARKPDATVIAVVRNAKRSTHLAAAIAGLKNVHVVEGDVVDYRSLEAAAKATAEITGGSLDCLIHNAARTGWSSVFQGFSDFKTMDDLDADLVDAFKTNALGVIHGISAFLPLLRASSVPLKKIVVMSTGGADAKSVLALGASNMVAYGMTKAAAHMATTKFATLLKNEGFVVVSITPGVVDTSATVEEDEHAKSEHSTAVKFLLSKTDLKFETPEESVKEQVKLLDGLTPSDNGLLLAHTGGEWTAPPSLST